MAPASPNELYDTSELVVIGRITDSTAKCEGSQIWTHMKVAVEDSAKNPQDIKVLTGKAYGGRIGNYGVLLEDSPIFNKGDRAFLYLYKDRPSDTVYRISQYSGVLALNDLPDETISAKEILKTFRLQFVRPDNVDTIEISQGASTSVPINIESFFGYDSPVNVTISSFAYYNDTIEDSNGTLTSEYADISALEGFGLSVEPSYNIVRPVVNGTSEAEFSISVSNKAVPGLYYIVFSASEDRYSYLAGGFTNSFVRINVTDSNREEKHFDSRFGVYPNEQILSLDMSYVEQNDPVALGIMTRIDNAVRMCENRLIEISYGLGSMRAAIEGWEGNSDLCSIAVMYEIEMAGKKLDCSVPSEVLPKWSGWMTNDVPMVDEIFDYCIKVGEINPFQEYQQPSTP